MARRCELTDVGPMSGNKVSHSNHKTRVRFLPNLQDVTLMSDALKRGVSLRITAATLRSVEHNGGLDSYLLSRSDSQLSSTGIKLKRQIRKAGKESEAA
jgi:large subunit ribosomal protein L28